MSRAPASAIKKYREFHRLDPKTIGEFDRAFTIPSAVFLAGPAKWVTYRSTKVDPESLRKPRKPIDYIHQHDAGVNTYLVDGDVVDGHHVAVPANFREVDALVRLGQCLGFCFTDPDGSDAEVEGRAPLPDLYTTPDGKCLLVVQSRREVLAMMWGGALGVFARGIDG